MLCIFDHTRKRVTASASMYCTISTDWEEPPEFFNAGSPCWAGRSNPFPNKWDPLHCDEPHRSPEPSETEILRGDDGSREAQSQTWDFKGNPRNRRTLRSQLTRASRVAEANVRCSERKGLLSVTWLPGHQKYKYISTAWPLNTDYKQKKKGEAFLFTTFLPNLPLDLIGGWWQNWGTGRKNGWVENLTNSSRSKRTT